MSEITEMWERLRARRGEGRHAELLHQPRPQIACPTWAVLDRYCYEHGLNPRKVRWLHEAHQLNGVHGRVILVDPGPPFPVGFMDALRHMRESRIIDVTEMR